MATSVVDGLAECPVLPLNPERFRAFVPKDDEWDVLVAASRRIRRMLRGRAVWAISSRSHSGGLAEQLQSQLAYTRGTRVDARWMIVGASDEFFRLIKLIHDNLHGEGADGNEYGETERRLYEDTLARAADMLNETLRPGDIVLLHDPETAGMIPAVKAAGASAIWRCRMGTDVPNDQARRARRFLFPYVQRADVCVFARHQFVWDGIDEVRARVILPSLSPVSPKNQELGPSAVDGILTAAGIEPGAESDGSFERVDGSPGRVVRAAELAESEPLKPGTPMILQVSQWNRLKDPAGVVDWFASHIAPASGAHLVLAGPQPEGVDDDPEAAAALGLALAHRRSLNAEIRERIHIVLLDPEDPEEAAVVLNALQRRATVIVQKSRGEGFGMTVLESMWKRRPVVGSRVDALQHHILDGVTGFLCDPDDPEEMAAVVLRLLEDDRTRERMGMAAHERVRDHFLLTRELGDWAVLIESLLPGVAAAGDGRT